jgi:hypothetical protein
MPNDFADRLARALHDTDCGCDTYDADEDSRYIGAARAALAALEACESTAREHVAVDEPGILWMAMRYALGRATYAVGEVVDAIERHAAILPVHSRERMAREIEQAGALTFAIDGPNWARAVAALRGPATQTAQGDRT